MNLDKRPVRAEIYLNRIAHNLREIRRRIGDKAEIMAVVKADAYGHGILEVAELALEAGAARLAVALVEEGLYLRQKGIKAPIQAMGGFCSNQIADALNANIILTVGRKDLLEEVIACAQAQSTKAIIHLKIDTGMGRYGQLLEETIELASQASKSPFIYLEGLMTHMSSADELDKSYSDLQMERFMEAVEELSKRGIEIPIKQLANSATIIDMPEKALDLVRPGIMLYGLWPSEDVQKKAVDLQAALVWKTQIMQIKDMPPGSCVSYGRTFKARKKIKAALLPLGYADGFNRLLSNRGYVLIRGQRAPILGRVCMDQTVVDVTNIPEAQVGDEVILIGSQGNERITAEDMAELLGTINYEVVCNISKRVPRFYFTEEPNDIS